MNEENILHEADKITSVDRQRYYGHPLDNHGNTAELWTSYLKRSCGFTEKLNARDVCLMQILLKVSRDANKPARDNLVDIAGYARNAEMVMAKNGYKEVIDAEAAAEKERIQADAMSGGWEPPEAILRKKLRKAEDENDPQKHAIKRELDDLLLQDEGR